MRKNILVIGENGQLGQSIKKLLYSNYFKPLGKTVPNYFKFTFIGRNELDLSDIDNIQLYFKEKTFDAIVNCAAYTAVDKAESESKLADKINHLAVKKLSEIAKLNNGIKSLKDEIATKETEVNDLYETYISEAEGRKGTLLIGKGPVYKEKRDKHDAALQQLAQLKQDNGQKILNNENAIAQLQADWKKAETDTQPIISNFDGFMARINALGKLPWLPSFFIFLLFLAIETAPIFAKLVSPKGEYDYKLEDEDTAIKNWVEQQVHQREELLNTDVVVNSKVYTDIQEDEEVYAYKRQKAKELMRDQADAFYEKQKKLL